VANTSVPTRVDMSVAGTSSRSYWAKTTGLDRVRLRDEDGVKENEVGLGHEGAWRRVMGFECSRQQCDGKLA
jgi:hypothetical protein